MKRTPQIHTRKPEIGLLGRVFVGVLALPFGIGAVLGVRRGDWVDALLFAAMFAIAGYSAWTGIRLYARGQRHRDGRIPRIPVHPKLHHGQRARGG